MPRKSRSGLVFRKLWPSERDKVRDHFLRLDPEDRHLRFFGQASDDFIERYCHEVLAAGYVVLAGFADGEVRAVGELRTYGAPGRRKAEIAISIERPYQSRGVGTELFRRLIDLARNRSIRTIHSACLVDNAKMQRIARKFGCAVEVERGQAEARLEPPWPSYFTLMEEAVAEGRAVIHTLLLPPATRLPGRAARPDRAPGADAKEAPAPPIPASEPTEDRKA